MTTALMAKPQVTRGSRRVGRVGTLVAREYLRVSLDRSGRQRSVAEQRDDNARTAEVHGFTLGEPYREKTAVSASEYATKVRDGFGELIADLERGTFGADVLILWESSRGARQMSEWVTLLDLCRKTGVLIHVTTHGRTYDPCNSRDRRSLLEDGTDNEYESAKMSARVKRATAANAAAGRPHGRTPYGYRRVFNARTGELINWEPDPDEAPMVREIYDRIRAGHSLRSIAKDFEARGIVARTGKPFLAVQLRSLVGPAHIGLRVHKGETVPATWDPIVSEDVYYAVRRILDDPKRRTVRPGRGVHEFTRIIRCDVCGGPLAVTHIKARPGYVCNNKGCVRVDKAALDKILRAQIFGWLSGPLAYEALTATRDDSAEVRQLDADLARMRAELAEAEGTAPESVYEAKTLGRLIERLTGEIEAAEARQRDLTMPPALRDLIEPGQDVAERWDATPVPARRKAAEILLSPGWLGQVRITPTPYRRAPAAERIKWRHADQPA